MLGFIFPLCLIGATLGPNFIVSLSYGAQERILGGREVPITAHPYMAAVEYNGHHACGATIIGGNCILTGAHCVQRSADEFTVRVGTSTLDSGGTVYNVSKLIIHPDYSFNSPLSKDFAIIILTEAVTASDSVQPVKLPAADQPVTLGTKGILAGWGRNTSGDELSENLKELSLLVVDKENYTGSDIYKYITPFTFTAAPEKPYEGACLGDTGGPFVANGTQLGVLSAEVDCENKEDPEVYGDVAKVRPWITKNCDI